MTEETPDSQPVSEPEPSRGRLPSLTSLAGAIFLPLLGVLAFIVVWWAWIEFTTEPGSFRASFGPEPGFRALYDLLSEGRLNRHIMASLERILVGLGIAGLIGIPLGMLMGGVSIAGRMLGAITSFIRMISPLSWTPLAIIWFGVGDAPVYFLIAIGAVWPVTLSTAAGVASLDRQWLMLGRSLRGTRLELLRTIVWPGIRGDVLTGLRLGLTTAWIILVPAEMLGVDSGMGYFILDSRDRFDYADLVAAIIVIGALGFVLDRLAHFLLTPRRRRRYSPGRVRSGITATSPTPTSQL